MAGILRAGCWVVLAMMVGLWGTVSPGVADEPAKKEATAEGKVDEENPLYSWQEEHDPNGIGKFYCGREIAYVMSFHGIPWLERPEREEEERLTLLLECLGLKPGMVVADVGAGSGVISLMMAKQVGEKGKVLAIDIQEEMLETLGKKLKEQKVTNVEPVLGTITSPNLKDASVDLALMVDVYHEFSHPHEMMKSLSQAMKPGGRIVFVEYRKEDPSVPIKEVHKMSEAQVKKEMAFAEFGLVWKETLKELPRQHVIIFEKKAGAAEKAKPDNDAGSGKKDPPGPKKQ